MTHTKIDHNFGFEQLSYDAKPNYQPYIKLSFFFRKLPHVSYEQFYRHWETVHADLTVSSEAFKANRIQRYVQLHHKPELREKAEALGMEILDWDGCSEIYVKEWSDWEKFYTDPAYAADLFPDSKHFMDMPIKVFVSYENVISGRVVPKLGGKDGIILKSQE